MAQDNTPDAINSIAKPVFAQSIVDLTPDINFLLKNVPFVASEKQLGRYYEQPTILTEDQGFTYADEDDGIYDLNDSIAMTIKSAIAVGQQITGKSVVSYKEAAVAVSAGKIAYKSAIQVRMESLGNTAAKRMEIAMIYGRAATGLGRSVTGTTLSSTQFRFVLPTSQWSDHIWAVSQNAELVGYNDTGTAINATPVSVYDVDGVNFYVKVSGSTTAISAIDSGIAAGINLFFRSAYGKEMYGLDAMANATGTMFGIDTSLYPLWRGNVVATSGALTLAKLLKLIIPALVKGMSGECYALVNYGTFANLANDESALVRYGASLDDKNAERGAKTITFRYQKGLIKIISHPVVKNGEAFVVQADSLSRVGATDLTFGRPGKEGVVFTDLESKNGFQFRVYADQAIFCSRLGVITKITGIVNA
ncbi:MAG: hypothetical protein E6R04_03250 [Spirochaetes bacterium]|nr:MAG: hypothetical protein E6R04_03250 [Spirochaetota bacterium]